MNPVHSIRQFSKLNQTKFANVSGTSQPTIAMYEANKKSPTWRTLEKLAKSVECQIQFEAVPEMTRDQKRSLAMHREIADQIEHNYEHIVNKANRNITKMLAAIPTAELLLSEWKILLSLDKSTLKLAILDPSLRGRDRRQVSPFAGILTTKQRGQVYRAFREAS